MNEAPIRGWRRVSDAELQQWSGGRLLAIGRAIAAGGQVRDLVRTIDGEVFGTVVDTEKGRDYVAGVVMEVLCKKRKTHHFHSACSCERAPCLHAVAVAFALRGASLWAGTGVPRMAKGDRRVAELPRPEIGVDFRDEQVEEGWW